MPAGATVDEPAAERAAAVDDTAEVDVEHPVEFLCRGVEEEPGLAHAGVVDHDVGHAVLGTHLLGEPLDGVGVGDVDGVGVRDAAAGGDLRGGVLDAGLVDVADHHFGAFAGRRRAPFRGRCRCPHR